MFAAAAIYLLWLEAFSCKLHNDYRFVDALCDMYILMARSLLIVSVGNLPANVTLYPHY